MVIGSSVCARMCTFVLKVDHCLSSRIFCYHGRTSIFISIYTNISKVLELEIRVWNT